MFRLLKKIIVLLLFVTLAAASSISIEPPKVDASLCLWDTIAIPFTVKNLGPTTDSINLIVNGSQFASILPNKLDLSPNKQDNAFVYVTPGCFSKTGKYALTVIGQSSTDKKTAIANIAVTKCVSTSVTAPAKVCLGDRIDIPLKIRNSAKISENVYKIESQLAYPDKTSLKPGEEKTITAQFDSKKYGIGTRAFKVKATALYGPNNTLTEDTGETAFSVKVESCTNALIEINTAGEQCSEAETTYPIKVTNTGREGAYTIKLTGLPFSTIKPSEVFLKQGETKELTLSIASGLKPAKYDFKVLMQSGDNTFAINQEIDFKKCYDVALLGNSDFVCQCQEKGFTIDAINTGAYKDSFYVTYTEGPIWIKPAFDSAPFALASDSKKTLSYSVFNCDAAPGKYTAVFKVNSVSTKSGDLLGQEITVKPREECYVAEFKTQREYAKPGVISLIQIPIKNTGLVENTYTLSVTGADWASFKEEFITIPEGGIKNAILQIAPPTNSAGGSFNLVVKATSKDVVSTKKIELIASEAPTTQPTVQTTTATPQPSTPAAATGAFTGGSMPLIAGAGILLLAGVYLLFKRTQKIE